MQPSNRSLLAIVDTYNISQLRTHDTSQLRTLCTVDGKRDPEAAAVRGDVVPEQQTICGMPVQFFAGLSYCASSAGMVLLNKFALSGFDFHSITSLLIFQCTFCVIAVHMCAALGLITLEVGQICTPSLSTAAYSSPLPGPRAAKLGPA